MPAPGRLRSALGHGKGPFAPLGFYIQKPQMAIDFTDFRQAIINGIISAQNELLGWNNEVRPKIPVDNVVRTSDTVATITIPAALIQAYDITDAETITVTVPRGVIKGWPDTVATPTFNIEVSLPSKGIRLQLQAVSRGSYY